MLACLAILATKPWALVLCAGLLVFAYFCRSGSILERQVIKIIWPTTSSSGGNGVLAMPQNADGFATEELLA